MKHLLIILLLAIISCKNQPKTVLSVQNGIDQTVYQMWDNYTLSNPEFKQDELPDADFFHNNETDANRLADLVIKGKKKASSGLYAWYKTANADLPKIGTKRIVTDFAGKAIAIIQIKMVDTIPFKGISKEYASMDMGTKIEPLKKWKKAHWDFFENALKENQQAPSAEMLIVCEIFETIWPKKL